MPAVSRTLTYEHQDCITCFITFMVPEGFTAKRRQDRAAFFCPNGHSMSYKQSEADTLRQERDRLKQQQARYEDELRVERELREAAERRVSAARGQVTKLKNRAANGVCPCCNRTFANLARHMQTKHAGFLAEEVTPEGATIQ